MLKDTFNSVLDNIKERTTNPFLGTLLIIWTIRNWNLVYSLLTFNKDSNLHSRLSYIKQHFRDQSFICNMIESIGITLGVLLITYLLLGLSRLLTDAYDKILIPQIARITDKTSIVLKSEHVALKDAFKLLEARLEEERLAKVTALKERDSADERLAEIISNNARRTSGSPVDESSHTVPKSFIRVANQAKEIWTVVKFNNVLTNIKNGTHLTAGDDIIRTLLRENFIIPGSSSTMDGKDYKLTDDGMAFLRYWNDLPDDGQLIV